MVWLDLAGNNGNGLYLDVRGVEWRQQRGARVCAATGTLGDGQYEGDVLLEVGADVEVTFADQWLAPQQLGGLFNRIERSGLEAALGTAARELAAALTGSGRSRSDDAYIGLVRSPHPVHGQLDLPLVMEEGAVEARYAG